MIDWNDLRYFLAVLRAGSLTAAGRTLGVDQSTVGRRLAILEDTCGARLFDRTPAGFRLTAAGESVLDEVAQIESRCLDVERRLAGRDARPEGTVRLATTETFATAFLVDRLAGLRERHPGVVVELLTGNVAVDLARREADIALRLGAQPTQPNLLVREIGIAAFGLFASPAYLARRGRQQRGDGHGGFAGHDIVGYAGSLAKAPLGRWIAEHAHAATIVLRTDNADVAFRAVVAGLGLGVLPALFAGHGLERIGSDLIGQAPIATIVHEDQARAMRVRAVLDYLVEIVRRDHALLAGIAPRSGNGQSRRKQRGT